MLAFFRAANPFSTNPRDAQPFNNSQYDHQHWFPANSSLIIVVLSSILCKNHMLKVLLNFI
jgi:hypothetical protein